MQTSPAHLGIEPLAGEHSADEALANPGDLDLLALLPCPLKVPVEEALRAFAAERLRRGARPLRFCIAGHANHEVDVRALSQETDARRLPAALLSPGLNAFFRDPFYRRFVRGGAFGALDPTPQDPALAALGLLDAERRCAVITSNPLVMLVDQRALKGRAVPRRIEDLFAPELQQSVAIRGGAGGFCETLLLSVWRRFGSPGVEKLARATLHGWHPSQMVKAAGSGRSDAPAASVLPLFFAEAARSRPGVRVVWPEDGAVLSPVTLLVRADREPELKDLAALLRGADLARIFAGAGFWSPHAEIPSGLPAGAPVDWLGWDFVEANDLGALVDELNAAFETARRAARGEPARRPGAEPP